jgi:hypothetical protein
MALRRSNATLQRFGCCEYASQAISESFHRACWIIGGYVYGVSVAGGFFQHVCGNSESVSVE